MFHALRKTYVNDIIEQLGSNIHPEYFTFDFGLDHRPTKSEIKQIEHIMRDYIAMSAKRNYIITSVKKAQELGAYMTIEESEYHDANNVRVVEFENITKDLCGGTHVENSSVIENFKIVSVDSKGTGIYRLRVVTSDKLVNEYLYNEIIEQQKLLSSLIKNNKELKPDYDLTFDVNIPELAKEKEKMLDYYEKVENQIREDYKKFLKEKNNESVEISNYKSELVNNIETFIIIEKDGNLLRKATIQLREAYQNTLIVGLSETKDNNYFLIVASKKYDSSVIFKNITNKLNGKGGGNKIVSQGSIFTDKKGDDLINTIKELINA
ncbi:alanyl-tRNA synthetase [Mycoplasmopsis arginini]|nr:alanyl-tRNA synthetase [Chlamydia abortus]SGA06349.1 alanyl-tRNA synthetase [Mycoplasmopsis arginini]